MQGHGVPQEINGIRMQGILLIHSLHWVILQIKILPRFLVIKIDVFDVLVEIHASFLFEKAHEAGLHGFRVVCGNFTQFQLLLLNHASLLELCHV